MTENFTESLDKEIGSSDHMNQYGGGFGIRTGSASWCEPGMGGNEFFAALNTRTSI